MIVLGWVWLGWFCVRLSVYSISTCKRFERIKIVELCMHIGNYFSVQCKFSFHFFSPSFVWLPVPYPFIDFLRVSLGSDRCEHENCFSFPSHSHFLVAFCCRAIDKITIMAGDGAKAQPKYIRDTKLACDDWSTERCVDVCSMFLCTTKWRGVVHKLYYRKIDLEIRMTTRTKGKCCHGNVNVDCGMFEYVKSEKELRSTYEKKKSMGHWTCHSIERMLCQFAFRRSNS